MKDVKVYGKNPDYWTAEWRNERVCVHAWGRYPSYSVLAGQACKQFVDMFDTMEEALKAYPMASPSHPLMQEQNYYNHLSDAPDY